MTIENNPAPRRRGRKLLMLVVPVALAGGGTLFWLGGGRYEATDNALLRQARISVASDISGRVVAVSVTDNEPVTAGDVLFQVDPEPYRLALAQADAALATARLGVGQLRAAYGIAQTQESLAANEAAFQSDELERQKALTGRGASTASALDKARHAADNANEALALAHQGTEAARAALGGDPAIKTDGFPAVQAALVASEKAAYNLKLTTVLAPADGVVYQASSFRPGQFVAAGAPLFTLVETGDSWVEANFKETQLTYLEPGQHAEVTFDLIPGRTFSATLEAIGAGTGSEFSLLPAQNATGNWVKVTQRVPVRLRLDATDALANLRVGVSASVSVDTGRSSELSLLRAHAATLIGK